MARCGDAIALTLNGTKFAIPKDTEPKVNKGGESITETQGFGDGTADAYVSIVIPKITGLRVKLSDDNRTAFENARKATDIPVVLECVSRSYECTGCIVGEIETSTTRNITEEFEIHVTDGSGIRET
jgi:hypothetical protein